MAKTLVYQLYAPAWAPVWGPQGGLRGMTQHIKRIAKLGVDYVWLSGALMSPQFDHGYDVSDSYRIDPRHGTMEDFDEFVRVAHEHGIGVLMDLILNHTSTKHSWFRSHPDYYCWSHCDRPGWKNLFDDGPVWKYYAEYDQYYLHLFHEKQADLGWFPEESGELNMTLVTEFRSVVDFWTRVHKADGFRIDAPQAINKDFNSHDLSFQDLISGSKAVEVLNAIFHGQEDSLFLMMECFDPTYGSIVDYYVKHVSALNFVLNVVLKDLARKDERGFWQKLDHSAQNRQFMIDLESHDSPRLTLNNCANPAWGINQLFTTVAKGICLYQGQELCLANPTRDQLPDEDLLRLDAQTAMRYARGESLDALRPISRANARIPLPLCRYDEKIGRSYFDFTKSAIKYWKEAN